LNFSTWERRRIGMAGLTDEMDASNARRLAGRNHAAGSWAGDYRNQRQLQKRKRATRGDR
jgi:hypothetical protein